MLRIELKGKKKLQMIVGLARAAELKLKVSSVQNVELNVLI